MVSAGETSGDQHAAHALQALADTGYTFASFGMGAGELEATGTELIVHSRELGVIGFVDVLINYPRFMKRLALLRRTLTQRRPDLLLIVDYPDFNLKLAETAREQGIPVLFYISPQVWAWRSKRITRIGRLVSHMAVLFPFEVRYYENAGIPVTYVGNPLVDDAVCDLNQAQAREALGLPAAGPIIALLPGSRRGEIERHVSLMVETFNALRTTHAELQAVVPCASSIDRSLLDAQLGAAPANSLHVIDGQAYTAMRAADVVLCASGTATLETALIGTPMAVMYITGRINYAIMSRLIRIPDISLVNIVAERRVVAEFIQHQATAPAMAAELERLLSNPDARAEQCRALEEVRKLLGQGGGSARVAALIPPLIGSS